MVIAQIFIGMLFILCVFYGIAIEKLNVAKPLERVMYEYFTVSK